VNISNLPRVNELVARRDRISTIRELKTDGVLTVMNEDDREISLDLTENEIQSVLDQRINEINTQLINLGVSLHPTVRTS
jgi:hypothetical protein